MPKRAEALLAWDSVNEQVLPVAAAQAPPQPCSTWPVAGVAVRTTVVPGANGAEQMLPQSMPAGCETSRPSPVTPTLRLTGSGAGAAANAAVTAPPLVRVQLLPTEPVQTPPHDRRIWPAAGTAVRVMDVLAGTLMLQMLPQSIPEGLVTRPLPLTFTLTR